MDGKFVVVEVTFPSNRADCEASNKNIIVDSENIVIGN